MFGTYLFRELRHRTRQTLIIAMGTAVAIALVMVVSAFSAGVRDAQSSVLEGVYGVGTDITVTGTPVAPEGGVGGPNFSFGADDGAAVGGARELRQTQLSVARGQATLDASVLDTIAATDGVQAVTASLSLQNTSFSGEIPNFGEGTLRGEQPGGADGAGGSSFSVDAVSALGVEPGTVELGALSAVALVDGRGLEASDEGAYVALVSETYAVSAELGVGDTVALGEGTLDIVGIVAASDGESETAADIFLPLDVAQSLSGSSGMVTAVAVQAQSADGVAAVQADLEVALPDATVSTQADLAASISGSLSTASSLVTSLGAWLSVLVLAAAFLIAILFTTAGVGRRTREFGTLKAIGWSNGRVVRQVAGESLAQGLIGGAIGVSLGLIGIAVINALGITLSAEAGVSTAFTGAGGGGFRGGLGQQGEAVTNATDVVVSAPISVDIIVVAVLLAILGGLLAGAFGGWRAARLRPAVALRTVA